jgi:hypothetical protein
LNDKDYRCWGKHRKLYQKLLDSGHNVRFRVCEFLWSEQKIPKEVIALAPTDKDRHLFLEIQIDNKWIRIDCSNDSKLPEYNDWDGKENCKVSVKYTKVLSEKESKDAEILEKKNYHILLPKYISFHKALNKSLKYIRKR